MFSQCVCKAGFADTGLATEEHNLSSSFFNLLPAVDQQSHFLLAAYQRRQRDSPRKRRCVLTLILYVVDGNRVIDAFHEVRAKRLTLKLPID